MGKVAENRLPLQRQGTRNQGDSTIFCERCSMVVSRICREFNFKCVVVLLFSVAVFLSSVFWLVPRNSRQSGFDAKEAIKLSATVQAYFRLQKPVSLLIPHMARLEYDIYGEIGVPSTKVAILSMHRAGVSDWTNVVVGVLSDPWNVSINSVSLSVLRSSLIELFLGHSNLTLTASIFGQPSSFEILKFPGGITVIPEQYASIWQIPQILFNFTLYNSINEIKENFVELKQQLKLGLYLRPNENVYVQVTNNYGSTRDPPVTVQASVMSDLGNLQPQRLKQLAQTITGSPSAENLGLNNSVFGKVKQISLSSYLNQTIHGSPPIPSPAPSPTPAVEPPISPSPALSPSNSPGPLPDIRCYPPCFNCDASSPSDDSNPSAPKPGNGVHHSLPPFSSSPAPSMVNTPFPRSSGCRIPPNPSPKSPPVPVAPAFSPRTSIYPPPIGPTPQMSPGLPPLPVVSYGSSQNQDKGNREGVSPPFASPSVSASLSSLSPGPSYKEIWLICFFGLLMFHLFLS